MFIVTTEAIDDGMWFDDPEGFDTETQARESAARRRAPPDGHCYGIYRCELLATLPDAEASRMPPEMRL